MHPKEEESVYNAVKSKFTGVKYKPSVVVACIIDLLQNFNIPPGEISQITQRIYIKLFQELGLGKQNEARQSWVVASGNNFEDLIRGVINVALNKEGILAIKGDRLKNKPQANEIIDFLTLRARRRCTQINTGVWPDSDIVVLTKDKNARLKVFALISCKTSDHSRNDSVMFWALALMGTNIKYCLATMDLDNKFKRGDDDPKISGHRKKAEAYLDRVYSTNPTTTECSQVFKLDLSIKGGIAPLLNDLKKWREEVVPNFLNEVIDQSFLV